MFQSDETGEAAATPNIKTQVREGKIEDIILYDLQVEYLFWNRASACLSVNEAAEDCRAINEC